MLDIKLANDTWDDSWMLDIELANDNWDDSWMLDIKLINDNCFSFPINLHELQVKPSQIKYSTKLKMRNKI